MSTAARQHDSGDEREVDPEDLVGALADLARQMQREHGSEATLEKVVAAAIAMIPGAEEASISVVANRRTVQSWAPSSDLPRRVDEVQTEVGEGPCLDAVFKHHVVSVPDLGAEQRWPRFAERASQLGAGSMLSFQLFIDGGDLGALNLYSRTPHAFTSESEEVGVPFAAHAAVALAAVQQREQMDQALSTRDLIGQAMGICMERFKIGSDQAFAVLKRISQDRNVKLRDLAEQLIYRGDLKDP